MARMLYEIERNVDVTHCEFFDLGDYGDSPDGLVERDGVIEIKSVTGPPPCILLLCNVALLTRPTNGNLSDILTVRVGIGLILSAIAATFLSIGN